MKTVSGNIISSKPISLSRAAKFLSNFITYDNGASHAISAYLQRTSNAFNELSEFHKKLKSSNSNIKSKRSKAGSDRDETLEVEPSKVSTERLGGKEVSEKGRQQNGKKEVDEGQSVYIQKQMDFRDNGSKSVHGHAHGEDLDKGLGEILVNGAENNSEAVIGKKHKKKHKRKEWNGNSVENVGDAREKDGEGTSRNSIHSGSDGRVGDDLPEKTSEKKKKKKRGREGDSLLENGVDTGEKEISEAKLGGEEGKKDRKQKRKSGETGISMEVDGLVEQQSKKTKTRMAD